MLYDGNFSYTFFSRDKKANHRSNEWGSSWHVEFVMHVSKKARVNPIVTRNKQHAIETKAKREDINYPPLDNYY